MHIFSKTNKVIVMKYVFILGLIISAFYIGAMQLMLTEVNNLQTFYSNADSIAQLAAEAKPSTQQSITNYNIQN